MVGMEIKTKIPSLSIIWMQIKQYVMVVISIWGIKRREKPKMTSRIWFLIKSKLCSVTKQTIG